MPGTIKAAASFNADTSAQQLDKAIRGWGTNESVIINLLTSHCSKQRLEIKAAYQKSTGKNLEADLKADLGGDFEKAVLAMFLSPAEYDAQELNRAMKRLGTKERILVEILGTRKNAEIAAIKAAYKAAYSVELEADIRSETSGDFRELLLTLCTGSREETKTADAPRADADARRLYSAGEKRLGTDETVFTDILCHRSFHQLKATIEAYKRVAGHEIEQAIESETSGDLKEAYLDIVKIGRNSGQYFAERLHKCMAGPGTRDQDLMRILVTRSEVDMEEIRLAYKGTYSVTLADAIRGDTSGDYKSLLIAILG
ncbi:annexin A13-like [Liolophura sinensis]|uniref:annexin A13-like n=1 Tax=Liolophura sinensis TaxID=3198878 RepID=UPI0031595434